MTSSAPRIVASLEWVRIDDDVIIFDGVTLHRLAGSAALVFLQMDGLRTPEQIVIQTSERRSVDRTVIERDVTWVVEDLLRRGLVTMEVLPVGSVFLKPEQIGYASTDDGILVADLVTGARHLLEPPASDVWTALLSTGTVEGALATLATRYETHPHLRDDVTELVGELVGLGLLTPSP